MNTKKSASGTGVGGITVFMVLAVLVIAVFAMLTMSAAQADLRLSEKNDQLTRLYYDLDAKGARLLATLESVLKAAAGGDYGSQRDLMAGVMPEILDPEAKANLTVREDNPAQVMLDICVPAGVNRWFYIVASLDASDPASTWRIEQWSLGSASFGGEEIDVGMPVFQ